jgi:RNA polymerase sigma-70 factor (ECF subfamily)
MCALDEEKSAAAYIVAIAERSDRAAFGALFARYAPRVKAFLLRRGAVSAEELTQEVMLTVWRKAASFDPARGSGEAWIFTIARNTSVDARRRERGQMLVDQDPAEEACEAPRGDALLEHAQEARRLRLALTGLPAEQREVIQLSFFEDQPHAEIAARLCLPLGTVKSRLRLAMKRLRDALDNES